MVKAHKLVIVGGSAFAEVAYEYFSNDSEYEVVAFSVERKYIAETTLFGVPVIPFEELEHYYPPADHRVFVGIVYTALNRLRTRLYLASKAKGYTMASYISPRAFVWRNCEIGEHCFIFEHNVIQPFVKIGNNVILWSGNHIGHHSVIKDNCFISSQVVVSGFCSIGENCFMGVNSTVANNITIARDNFIGAGVLIQNNTEGGRVYQNKGAQPATVGSLRFFKVKG